MGWFCKGIYIEAYKLCMLFQSSKQINKVILKMKYLHALLITFCIWGILMVPGCSSQTPDKNLSYPACEPRSNTDPARLNIRASAEDFGMISPCKGKFELYINPNSQIRSLVFDLEYLNTDNKLVFKEQVSAELKQHSTGMFQKEITVSPVEGESCRNLQIAIQSMACYSVDGNLIDCPEIRILSPDTFESINLSESLNVCADDS